MADKNGRERLSLYFNTQDEKEYKLWEYITSKYSKSGFVKEAIEEKMLRESYGIDLNQLIDKKKEENIHEEIHEITKVNKQDIDKNYVDM